jgi:hypothetical protein
VIEKMKISLQKLNKAISKNSIDQDNDWTQGERALFIKSLPKPPTSRPKIDLDDPKLESKIKSEAGELADKMKPLIETTKEKETSKRD